MKQVTNLEKINNLSYFDTDTVSQITSLEGNSLYKNISRWVDQGRLIQLKRGVYTAKSYYDKRLGQDSYVRFIANKLRYPSYLSLEYVLGNNQILTESVFVYTSITLKSTRAYSNDLGKFVYRNISEKLFTGFEIMSEGEFEVAIASKGKALFDYLYLKFYRNTVITEQMINELRLNFDRLDDGDIREFGTYCELSDIQKYKLLPELLFNDN